MYRPANVLPPDAPGLRALTSLVAGIAVIGALYFGREVLIPVTLAVLLSFLVEPSSSCGGSSSGKFLR